MTQPLHDFLQVVAESESTAVASEIVKVLIHQDFFPSEVVRWVWLYYSSRTKTLNNVGLKSLCSTHICGWFQHLQNQRGRSSLSLSL